MVLAEPADIPLFTFLVGQAEDFVVWVAAAVALAARISAVDLPRLFGFRVPVALGE